MAPRKKFSRQDIIIAAFELAEKMDWMQLQLEKLPNSSAVPLHRFM